MTRKCKELKSRDEFELAFPILKQLEPTLERQSYLKIMDEGVPQKMRAYGLWEGNILLSVALAYVVQLIEREKLLWIYYLVTEESHRSKGYGAELLSFIESYARENEFQQLRVHSEVRRRDAHRFYETKGEMFHWANVYRKNL